EDLAIVTGRGDERLVNLSGAGPMVAEENIVVIGIRADDVYLDEVAMLAIAVHTSEDVSRKGPEAVAGQALDVVTGETDGFWVHLDFDVVDADEMPAVDSPAPNGLSFAQLGEVVGPILASPACVGMELTIYDPDLDDDGRYGDAIVGFLEEVFEREPAEGVS
ncbi:MAG: arginase family protein, partial [Chloroflexota bacterium]